MTPAEFEALQVGDVVRHGDGTESVIFTADHDVGIVSTVISKTPTVCMEDQFGEWCDHDFTALQDWSVVSRVLSRENVKGGTE